MGETTVVTGAAGHLGANLVRALLAHGRRVRALDFTGDWRSLEGLTIERVQADTRDVAAVREAIAGADVVYHCAARISLAMDDWPLVEAINVFGTRHLVQACLAGGVRRLIHFSSIHSFEQRPLTEPLDETRPPADTAPCPPYDRSKAAGEREVRQAMAQGLDAVILNPTAMIGPYDFRPSHFGRVLLALARGELPVLIGSGFDWVDARDVAIGALLAEEKAPAGRQYLLSGHLVSMPELAALSEELTGTPAPHFVCPLWLARLAAELWARLRRGREHPVFNRAALRALGGNRNIRHDLATRELGYQPRPFRETLADTYRWFAEVGWLGPRAR